MKSCTFPGCPNVGKITDGLCASHYMRRWRYGDPATIRGTRLKGSPDERFLARLNLQGPTPTHAPALGPCHEWTGARVGKGYGRIRMHGKSVQTHVYGWTRIHGPVSPGQFVCHRCDNPSCCNPAHLYVGSLQDNARDAKERGLVPRGSQKWNVKLTEWDVRDIREMYPECGLSQREIAEGYGVSTGAIAGVCRRKTWAWVEAL